MLAYALISKTKLGAIWMMPCVLEILQLVCDLQKKRNDFQKTSPFPLTGLLCAWNADTCSALRRGQVVSNEWILVLLVLIIANMSSNILKKVFGMTLLLEPCFVSLCLSYWWQVFCYLQLNAFLTDIYYLHLVIYFNIVSHFINTSNINDAALIKGELLP